MIRWLRRPVVWVPVSLALLALVAARSRPWELGPRLGAVDPAPIAVALLLNCVILLAWAVRSAGLLAAAGSPVSIAPLIPMTAFANTINNVTPGSVGELARLYLLKARHGVGYGTGAAVIVVERFVAIGYLGASAATLWLAWLYGAPWLLVAVVLLLVAALPVATYRLGLRPSSMLGVLPARGRLVAARDALRRVDDGVARLLSDPRRAGVFAAWSAVVFASYAAQLWLVAAAIDRPIDPAAAWGALGVGIVVGVVSLLPFGLGSTDLVVAAMLGAAGLEPAEAGWVVLAFRVVSTLPLGVAGAVSFGMLSARLPHGSPADAARSAARALEADPGEPV